ncbi:MAG: protein dehydratase [Robiginitomaculum sp.]|nr:MAG: protein dehydratase [Robiginitomaculum sp.]
MDIKVLQKWIGREESATEQLTPSLAAKFNATFDLEAPTDLGSPAPYFVHYCLAQPCVPTAQLGPDGHPKRGGFLPPVPLPLRMWAGGSCETLNPISIGDVVTRRSVIEDVAAKEGRSGSLCFVTVRHYFSCGDKLAIRERQDIVYRTPSQGEKRKPDAQAPRGAKSKSCAISSPLLFRYSALTFNGHRIHYDAPYARDTENYAGLVTHGPLQATLLAHYAAAKKDSRPGLFSYRLLSAIEGGAALELNADSAPNGLSLWAAQPGGPVSIKASATW